MRILGRTVPALGVSLFESPEANAETEIIVTRRTIKGFFMTCLFIEWE